ncbi:hypothetical protein F8M41_006466 [Gigaspora margarita]|uniref:Uncharacterized protein n=1 Tax=Gigaspora margarita TaxID=4874 RepID=A0A8H3X803_GIGMA|nr:hypothetical protein F8M41_006466 [Gigaspora margarita]
MFSSRIPLLFPISILPILALPSGASSPLLPSSSTQTTGMSDASISVFLILTSSFNLLSFINAFANPFTNLSISTLPSYSSLHLFPTINLSCPDTFRSDSIINDFLSMSPSVQLELSTSAPTDTIGMYSFLSFVNSILL